MYCYLWPSLAKRVFSLDARKGVAQIAALEAVQLSRKLYIKISFTIIINYSLFLMTNWCPKVYSKVYQHRRSTKSRVKFQHLTNWRASDHWKGWTQIPGATQMFCVQKNVSTHKQLCNDNSQKPIIVFAMRICRFGKQNICWWHELCCSLPVSKSQRLVPSKF